MTSNILWHTWMVKIGTNFFQEEVLVLEDSKVLMYHRLSTIATIFVRSPPPNPDGHPTSRFSKSVHWNPSTPTVDHKTYGRALDSVGYYVESLPFHIQDFQCRIWTIGPKPMQCYYLTSSLTSYRSLLIWYHSHN